MVIKDRTITARDRAVVHTMIMRLERRQAVEFLAHDGYKMSVGTYDRIKSKLKKSQYERLNFIAGFGFERQHLERLDTVEYIAKLQWRLFWEEESPFKRSLILKEIRELQPLISAYYDSTRSVMKQRRGNNITEPLSEPDPRLPDY